MHGSLFFCAKTIAIPVKKRYHGCRRKQKELCPCGRRPATTPERKGASFYEKLEEITWKDASLWYLTRPMTEDDIAETHVFKQSSNWGVLEGTVTIVESKK